MSGTALYRALVSAGAPEDQAKEAANDIDSDISEIKERLTRVETMLKINTIILVAILIKSFF